MEEKTRREILILVTAPIIAAALNACGGTAGGSNQTTVLLLTKAQGYEPTFSSDNPELVSSLKRNGEVVMEWPLYFTVNGHRFDDGDGPVGSKSVYSNVQAGDTIRWQQWQ